MSMWSEQLSGQMIEVCERGFYIWIFDCSMFALNELPRQEAAAWTDAVEVVFGG